MTPNLSREQVKGHVSDQNVIEDFFLVYIVIFYHIVVEDLLFLVLTVFFDKNKAGKQFFFGFKVCVVQKYT